MKFWHKSRAITLVQMCDNDVYNPKLDLVNINKHIKFDDILSICYQDIERKRNFERNSDINQGPELYYKCGKNDV